MLNARLASLANTAPRKDLHHQLVIVFRVTSVFRVRQGMTHPPWLPISVPVLAITTAKANLARAASANLEPILRTRSERPNPSAQPRLPVNLRTRSQERTPHRQWSPETVQKDTIAMR